MKKHRGSYDALIGYGIGLIAICLIMVCSVHFIRLIECKRQVSLVARQCLLYLEEEGELSAQSRERIEERLTALGFGTFEVTCNGDNTRRRYGEEVSVSIHVDATLDEIGIWQIWGLHDDRYEFNETLYSVCKSQA